MGKKKVKAPTDLSVARAADKVIEAARLVKAGRGPAMQVVQSANALIWTIQSAERDTSRKV